MPPDRVEVVVDPTALTRSPSGSIAGPVWLRFGGDAAGEPAAFPQPGWSDFPVVVLAWWLARLARDLGGREAVERCDFMDGPFRFTVRRRRGDPRWELAGSEGGGATGPAAHVEGAVFLDSLAEGARAVHAECAARGWGGADVEALARAVEQAAYYRAT